MFDAKLEQLAEEVRASAGLRDKIPVDLEALCEFEEIALIPLLNHAGFHGKIEFLAEANKFAIYHPDPATYRWPKRIRFSIAHELGHYHIEEHRDALVQGKTHNSIPGFKSKEPREREADEFAAALLIPRSKMEPKIDSRGYLEFAEILKIADDCCVSSYATTIRYVRMASEACLVILAKDGKIENSFHSDEARANYFGRITCSSLPPASPGHSLSRQNPGGDPVEKRHDAEAWFDPNGGTTTTWEHCIALGQGYTLSLLAIELENDD
jgi:hypothetical protein